ncbi:ATP-binding protein [Acidithiobacillus sp. HP-6]|uniref:ATP-binding protein n=1 Tax=unclassified Acidithiobacillus TaxID=2614800 RepID=UPI001879F23E|nr:MULTISPECIES: ATP-binding protein [unclassified Acidithiobacillus]MBE7562064.1 ATP-binding protein [Acidithiobacillus sp. HP-6]MBE7568778.1 ATP-binding protein [Acidithiobacillus sp. HP-2]
MERQHLLQSLAALLGDSSDHSLPDFASIKAARWRHLPLGGRLEAVSRVDLPDMDELLGIDETKAALELNTRQFVAGFPANDALLWGGRGTGKSSLVKALLRRYADQGLRLIEIDAEGILDLPEILAALQAADPEQHYHFALFCDDLSFGSDDPGYKALKSLLDGGVEARPDNVLLYATSNRRHLMPRHFSDNDEYHRHGDEIIAGETAEEKISLSERFGLWLGFYPFDQTMYLDICAIHLRRLNMPADPEQWQEEALRWALQRGSRSGRVARQFARHWAGSKSLAGQ